MRKAVATKNNEKQAATGAISARTPSSAAFYGS